MKQVYKASIQEMREAITTWLGAGANDESAVRIAQAYMSIHGFECVGSTGKDTLLMVDADPSQKLDGVVVVLADKVPEHKCKCAGKEAVAKVAGCKPCKPCRPVRRVRAKKPCRKINRRCSR